MKRIYIVTTIGVLGGFLIANFLCERLALAFGERSFVGRGLLTISITLAMGKLFHDITTAYDAGRRIDLSMSIDAEKAFNAFKLLLCGFAAIFIDKILILLCVLFVEWLMPWAIESTLLGGSPLLAFKWGGLWAR